MVPYWANALNARRNWSSGLSDMNAEQSVSMLGVSAGSFWRTLAKRATSHVAGIGISSTCSLYPVRHL